MEEQRRAIEALAPEVVEAEQVVEEQSTSEARMGSYHSEVRRVGHVHVKVQQQEWVEQG